MGKILSSPKSSIAAFAKNKEVRDMKMDRATRLASAPLTPLARRNPH
eukprot:UN10688